MLAIPNNHIIINKKIYCTFQNKLLNLFEVICKHFIGVFMKISFLICLGLIISSAASFAQMDTLFIHLKNGTIEKVSIFDISSMSFETISSVGDDNLKNSEAKNYPNPFSDGTTIEFEIESTDNVRIFIYDYLGNLIRTLSWDNCPAGKNQLNWDTKNHKGETVPSGVYYYEILSSKKTIAKQMLKIM